MNLIVFFSFLVAFQSAAVFGLTDLRLGTSVRSFGGALKGGLMLPYPNETIMFEHNCTLPPCQLTECWFTGTVATFPSLIIRFYIDDEAPLEFELYRAHGIGFENDATQPPNQYVGKNAHYGGIYNTYRVPFASSIRVTWQLPVPWVNGTTPAYYWSIVRGLEGAPIVVGDFALPDSARLRLYKNENITLQPLEFTTLATSSGTNGGMIFQVFVEARSTDPNFLEACFRLYLDGASSPMFLSSGTEDFFLSAYYFNGGTYFGTESGLTTLQQGNNSFEMSAYKFFVRDPLLWSSSFKLVWRNMEDASCPNAWIAGQGPAFVGTPRKRVGVAPNTYSSYVWTYEW